LIAAIGLIVIGIFAKEWLRRRLVRLLRGLGRRRDKGHMQLDAQRFDDGDGDADDEYGTSTRPYRDGVRDGDRDGDQLNQAPPMALDLGHIEMHFDPLRDQRGTWNVWDNDAIAQR